MMKKYNKVIDYEISHRNYTVDHIRGVILETPIIMTYMYVNISDTSDKEMEYNITTELSEIGIGSGFIKLDPSANRPSFKITKVGNL